jgi:hypothetical protein
MSSYGPQHITPKSSDGDDGSRRLSSRAQLTTSHDACVTNGGGAFRLLVKLEWVRVCAGLALGAPMPWLVPAMKGQPQVARHSQCPHGKIVVLPASFFLIVPRGSTSPRQLQLGVHRCATSALRSSDSTLWTLQETEQSRGLSLHGPPLHCHHRHLCCP